MSTFTSACKGRRLGKRAQITHVHPYKFRHTYAITYLRSGGDVFTLQSLLGHGSLDMVRHYTQIAEIDVEQAHRRATAQRTIGDFNDLFIGIAFRQ